MSDTNRELYTLVNHTMKASYEFHEKANGYYTVTRVWLVDNEGEFMGTYDKDDARSYWNSLVDSGFVRA
jgi:hypothetical protein